MAANATPVDVIHRLITGVPEGRWDELPTLYAPDAVVEHPMALPEPARLVGRAAVEAHFAAAAQLPLRMRAENVVVHEGADPELAVGEFDYVGVVGDAPFRTANVLVVRVRDGLIVHSRDYHDHARLGAALTGR
jgi:uncharacterized protein